MLPFTTRDTVVVETPANLATSLTVLDTSFRSVDAFTTLSLFSVVVRIPDPLSASISDTSAESADFRCCRAKSANRSMLI